MGRTYKTEGIILKRTNFGEADRILTVYTKHYGKIKALAKGVRKVASRKGGSVEAFNQVVLFLVKGKNLDLLSEVQVINSFKSWRKNLAKVGVAYYFCEIVDKLTPEGQDNKAVFALLEGFLSKLGRSSEFNLVRPFEEQLLEELGFGVPAKLKKGSRSLKAYIESIVEKEISTPEILLELTSS